MTHTSVAALPPAAVQAARGAASVRTWLAAGLLLCGSIGFASAAHLVVPRLTAVTLEDDQGRRQAIASPFFLPTGNAVRTYKAAGEIRRSRFQLTRFRLMPAQCLSSVALDGWPVRFKNAAAADGCQVGAEYELYLPPTDRAGAVVRLTATLTSLPEAVGLRLEPPRRHPVVIALHTAAVVCLAGLLILVARRGGLAPAVIGLLLVALGVQLAYLEQTPFFDRTYDVLGHLQHIAYVADRHAMPPTLECWECYQPPLSYAVAAAVYGTARSTGWLDPMTALQMLSLAWSWVFLSAAVATIRLWRGLHGHAATIAIALVAFWPAGVLHSSRISNDPAAYACFAVGFYFALRWWQGGRRQDLLVASLVAAGGLLVKATMLILCGALGTLILVDIWRRRAVIWPSTLAVLIMAAGFLSYIAVTAAKGGGFTGPGLPNPEMFVGNRWQDYLLLDVRSYFALPFISSITPGGGREYFWNYVLKSSMFGDYDWFRQPVQRTLALVIGPALLGLVGVLGFGVARAVRTPRTTLPLLLAVGFSFTALVLYRFGHPYSCNNDVRFIYPAIVPIVILMCDGIQRSRSSVVLAITFCALSAAFYLTV